MSARSRLIGSAFGSLLRGFALILPRQERDEWLAEWRGEIHHLLDRDTRMSRCVSFTLGAFPDALWIRRHSRFPLARLESPRDCLACVGALAMLSVALCLLLPQTRRELMPVPWAGPASLAVLAPEPSMAGSGMLVSAAQYESWRGHLDPRVMRAAFYEAFVSEAEIHSGVRRSWYIGRASASMADLLGVHIPDAPGERRDPGAGIPVVLSHATWLRFFGGDPGVVGRVIRLSGRKAVVAGVAPSYAAALPAGVNAWTLEPDQSLRRFASNRFSFGYMVAALAPQIQRGGAMRRIALTSDEGASTRLFVIPVCRLAEFDRHIPQLDYLLSLFTACLMVPAVFSIRFRTGWITDQITRRLRTRGWVFVGAKIALLLPLLYCGPLVLASFAGYGMHDYGYAVQIVITTCGSLAATFWVFDDQRQRCPSCLHKLTSPAQVGELSRSFLGFSGVEFVCREGHGLLHVPDFPTSWFSAQRWSTLDTSWKSLFQHTS